MQVTAVTESGAGGITFRLGHVLNFWLEDDISGTIKDGKIDWRDAPEEGRDTLEKFVLFAYREVVLRMQLPLAVKRGESLEQKLRRAVADRPGSTRSALRNAVSHHLKADEVKRALAWLAIRGEINEQKGRYYPPTEAKG